MCDGGLSPCAVGPEPGLQPGHKLARCPLREFNRDAVTPFTLPWFRAAALESRTNPGPTPAPQFTSHVSLSKLLHLLESWCCVFVLFVCFVFICKMKTSWAPGLLKDLSEIMHTKGLVLAMAGGKWLINVSCCS